MIRISVLILNIAAAIILFLAFAASYVPPINSDFIPILGLVFPYIVIFNALFILLWIFIKPIYCIFPIICIAITFNTSFIFYASNKIKKIDGSEIKIMSYNVKNFDVYNYTVNWDYKFDTRNKIFSLFREENPDILCIQEYYYEKTKRFKTNDTLSIFLKAQNMHTEFFESNRNSDYFGMATYTKYPIINKGRIEFETRGSNGCIFTDVLIKKDTVRIYNVHFESIHLADDEFNFADSLSNESNSKIKKETQSLIYKLNKAFKIRAKQVKLVKNHIDSCKYPIILCGDFNDTPASFTYGRISSILVDAFINSGNGIGSTYAGKIPAHRIDYIFTSDRFKAKNFEVIHKKYSDHYPIKCLLNILKL